MTVLVIPKQRKCTAKQFTSEWYNLLSCYVLVRFTAISKDSSTRAFRSRSHKSNNNALRNFRMYNHFNNLKTTFTWVWEEMETNIMVGRGVNAAWLG